LDCKYFGVCGACQHYENGYEFQLEQKVQHNREMFSPFYSDKIEVFSSPTTHYRSRSEFKIWHIQEELHYAMNHKDKKGVVLIDECPQVNIYIAALMPKLLQAILDEKIGFKLFGADFLSSSGGEIVVSLLYHRKLDGDWEEVATKIAKQLGIYIIGRSRGQKLVTGQDYITEHLNVNHTTYQFHHIENSFTQPNAKVNEAMIQWALNQFSEEMGDLLELYCGAGNFTIPFASIFNKVLATEISKSSINAAKNNMLLNHVENIEFIRMSVEDFVKALENTREFIRMKEIDLSAYDIKSVFVDPPRSGLDEVSCSFIARYEQILYISCNPETLLRDLGMLCKTHTTVSMALFDQFPYTHHVEMGVKLVKKN